MFGAVVFLSTACTRATTSSGLYDLAIYSSIPCLSEAFLFCISPVTVNIIIGTTLFLRIRASI